MDNRRRTLPASDAPALTRPEQGPAWPLGLAGLALCVFAVVALTSPGRIDVVDGHTRYEVGRSYVEHGDSIVRNPDAWFAVFPGRNGELYSNYRFPQSIVAAAAILASDLTGPVREIRRHFFFSLSGAVLCAAIAVLYACWFRRMGHGRIASLAWAAGGIFCTPTWFYGTTTFDDVLGSLVVLLAIFAAGILRQGRPIGAAVVSGSLLGLAFNCKPPLALFLPVAVAALWDARRSKHERWLQARIVFFCAAVGVIGYEAYDLWKFPPSTWKALADAREEYVAMWPGSPLAGFLSLLVSPGMGALGYWPAIVIALFGLVAWRRQQRLIAGMTGLSCLFFLAFIGSIRFFSGEPAWGPRYLTPVFALLWLVVPAGATRLRWPIAASLLALSFIIQLAGLSIDTLRFFSGENELAVEGFLNDPWTYFRPGRSQLLARSRQIWEVMSYDGPAPKSFSPAKKPSLPLTFDLTAKEPLEATRHHTLSTFRPWWCAYPYLAADERPVDLRFALKLLLATAVSGLMLLACVAYSGIRENSGAGSRLPHVGFVLRDRSGTPNL
ncbi:MAG TPA: hypothetical protein VNH11_14655 [Pirellulales bacterium]|nr:hypothetical protein [Pirellulales bacterium]